MSDNPYQRLAQRLDALPNGFPPTPDGAELRLLEKLFSPEEAALAAELNQEAETPAQIAARLQGDPLALQKMLKGMARRGLIRVERTEHGLVYGLLPFVVGIYEMQVNRLDRELAWLFENYYQQAFGHLLRLQPPVHRVIPVGESIRVDLEIQPYESVEMILAGAKAWGVVDCICRKQQALIGKACSHPLDVCMVLSQTPGAFDNSPAIRPLTHAEALATLQRAAQAGLVHSVSNNQQGITYICNCCTCACGILRGIRELGIANVVARSAFVNQVNESLCQACGLCAEACQFGALTVSQVAEVSSIRCVGCGVCVLLCPEGALGLVPRPEEEVKPPPLSEKEWGAQRLAGRTVKP